MGIYESEDGRFFVSTYDPDPTNWTRLLTPKGEVDTVAALKIQKWWRTFQNSINTENTENTEGTEGTEDSGYYGDIDNFESDTELPVSRLTIFSLLYIVTMKFFEFIQYLSGF